MASTLAIVLCEGSLFVDGTKALVMHSDVLELHYVVRFEHAKTKDIVGEMALPECVLTKIS